MKKIITEKRLHESFEISILLKGLHSVIEIIGGIFIVFTSKASIVSLVTSMTNEELIEDPRDVFAHYLIKSTNNLSISGQQFAALYLLSHGVIKFFVIWGLYNKKMWAYPTSIAVFTLFIIYQLYRYTFTHSLWLIVFSVFDVIVILLTIHEWRRMRVHDSL